MKPVPVKFVAFVTIFILALTGAIPVLQVFAQSPLPSLIVLTGEFPPFAVDSDDGPSGRAVDAVNVAMRRAGIAGKVDVQPWKRAFSTVAQKENYALLLAARTPPREDQFQWVYKLFTSEISFLSKKGKHLTEAEARGLNKVCVLDRSIMSALLENKGFTNLLKVPDNATCARLLAFDRVNAVFGGWRTTAYGYQLLGFPKEDIVPGETIHSTDVYFVASNQTDKRLVDSMRKAFVSLREEGLLDKMLDGN